MNKKTHNGGAGGIEAKADLPMLEKRFHGLWSRCVKPGSDPAGADRAWKVLAQGYSEPHRHYHDIGHLKHCLHGLGLAATVAHDPATLELAIWFHDLVYDPGAKDNEERSAEVFASLVGPYMAPERVDRIRKLIMTTMHREQPEGGDERFIADIDLSSFAKPWPQFLTDGDNLRAEEPDRSDEDFYAAKIRFYRSLLQRRRIFNTVPFQLRYEAHARENIERYLALLAERGYR